MLRTFTLLLLFSYGVAAQMNTPAGARFGNEWWQPGTRYLKIAVTEDAMYRLDAATLAAAGFPVDGPEASRYVLHHFGQALPIDLAADGLRFYGERGRGELDQYLFDQGEAQQLNPRYGMHTDTAVYYLSVAVAGTMPPRYQAAASGGGGTVTNQVIRRAEQVFSREWNKFFRRESGQTITFSHYDLAEGYGSRRRGDLLSSNGSTETTTELSLPQAIAGTAQLTLRYALAFGPDHLQQISVNGQVLEERSSQNWDLTEVTYEVASENELTVRVKGLAGDRDKASLAFIRVDYPSQATLAGANQLQFSLPAGAARTLTFTGELPAEARLYDLTAGRRYLPQDGGFALPATDQPHRFQLVARPQAVVGTESWTPDAAALLPPAASTYLILSSRRLAGTGLDELARYRSSATGGGHRVHTVYVEDLYDAFGYGYQRHPQALKNYLDAALVEVPELQYLFIVGKGREYVDVRSTAELDNAQETFLVPGYGLPASDNLLTAPLGEVVPRLATGRLAAITPQEVSLYVGKLMAVERQVELAGQTIEDLDWMKQALFLGGGGSPSEQSAIQYNLGTMERIFETSKLGGNVTSVFRTSTDPIETTRTEAIFDRINGGTSVITFYGHSSSQGFDFNIDNPQNYKNLNKYPYMMSLGCYSGDAFTESRSISERFIFLEDGGAVTFAASKGLGYIGALGIFGRSFFQQMTTDDYGGGVGDMLQAVVADYAGTNNFTLGVLLEQFSLSGDPAFRFHPRPGPDLVFDPSAVSFSPPVLPVQDSVFEVTLRLLNLGTRPKEATDSIWLTFSQELPSGEVRSLARRRVAVPYYDSQPTLQLPTLGLEAVGINRLLVTLDADNELAEEPAGAAEANNELRIGGAPGAPFTVISNTAKTAFPPDYAVVGPGVELVANTTDPTAPERTYRLQLSTDIRFSDPLIDTELTVPGGVIRYRPSVTFSDSTTYYWRISPDSSQLEAGFVWSRSSFTYLADQSAERVDFAQQHPGQLATGITERLVISPTTASWRFAPNTNDIEFINGPYVNRDQPALIWNGQRFNSPHPWRIRAGIQVMVIDSTSNSIWYKPPTDNALGSRSRAGDTPWAFETQTTKGRESLIQFIEEIPEGRYVFLWSVQRGDDPVYHTDEWMQDSTRFGRTLYGVLEREGAEQVRLLEDLGSVPYVFTFVKGIGPIAEGIANSQESIIRVFTPIHENWNAGSYTSDRIGPALDWDNLKLSFRPENIGPTDSVYLRLYGESIAGQRTLLEQAPLQIKEKLTYQYDLSTISPAEHPYLRIAVELYDDTERSAASLDEFYVTYTRPGDIAVSPAIAYEVPDTLAQGEEVTIEIGYENLSSTPMDSLLVQLSVTNDRNEVSQLSQRQPPVAGGGSGSVLFALPTEEGTTGLRLELALNPNGDQLEDITFNNYLTVRQGVESDQVAPDLKVYYDGRHIRNGELISSRPEILMQLRDENRFRRLDDSSAYQVQLTRPDGSREQITLSDSRIEFIPAGPEGENMAEIYFRPELLQDGAYTLEIQATDRSKNAAGRLNYQQSFEVINQQSISNVLTYPNPFTTRTRFVYTLTGSVAPETFRIQIMTVSGRVVRDIDLLAHETITPGTHRTDFSWDGTDEYGDPLANGVYLYRVITSDSQGTALEGHDNGTDQYFRNGLGKVVILR